jgi:hypothetical protein
MRSSSQQLRGGVLVVSVWIDADGKFRARVTETSDIDSVTDSTCVVKSTEELLQRVEKWADGFATAPDRR